MRTLDCLFIIAVIFLVYYVANELLLNGETFENVMPLVNQETKGTGASNANNSNKPLTAGAAANLMANDIMKSAYGDSGDPALGDEESRLLAANLMANGVEDGSYGAFLVASQLDEDTLASHQQFVYDQHRLRSKGGTAAHHAIFTPTDPVPWVGLRRPDYTTPSSDFNTRMGQEYSVRSSQLQQQQPNMLGL